MKTRGNTKDPEYKMEEQKQKKKQSRTEIMRRYRANLKPDKIEATRSKDRERKRLKRVQQKNEIMNGNRELHEKLKYQNRKNMKFTELS